jgi:hypothetical protein
MQPLKVFIGFDPRAHVAYHACHNSIFSRCSKPVLTGPLVLPTLPITKTGLTQFTYTRFLVPHLCEYKGYALFMDCSPLPRPTSPRRSGRSSLRAATRTRSST